MSGVPDPDGPPPPTALLSTPVYSLVTRGGQSGRVTMNIITYCNPVAIRPVRKMCMGLYIQSLTWEHVREVEGGVLQVGRGAVSRRARWQAGGSVVH